jgi:hypothetical protein
MTNIIVLILMLVTPLITALEGESLEAFIMVVRGIDAPGSTVGEV